MSILEGLPPSPPSTSSRRKPLFTKSSMNLTSTPESPASIQGSSSNGTRKRVEFSPWTNASDLIHASECPSTTSTVKPLPPSSECQASLKSILKTTQVNEEPLPTAKGQKEEGISMGAMMESIVQQLAGDERTISVDAYQTLAKVIRQYDDIPDEAVLKSKVTKILKYIRRDLLKPIDEIADTNLITQALKVLVIFVWNAEYSSFLTDEYRLFILDRSILVISEHTAPKSVIIHYLHLLATQDFRPVLLASHNRVLRLLDSLKALSEHIKGIGVTLERLLVYRKLLEQSKANMQGKANLWTEELLTGLINSCKEVRVKAIDFGVQVCSTFPASSSISHATRTVLERELEKEVSFGTAICRRLEKMIASKDDMVQVPQIWSTIVLLSNSTDTRIDNWVDLKNWLKVIQKCFNGSDSILRQQSNLAWNRLVYVARPHEASDTLLGMLAKPITIQLERQSGDKSMKGSRATAVGSYCTLLYYAFRPASTHKQYTRVWNEYIVKVMRSSFFEKNPANSDMACRVFIALLWNSSKGTKMWHEGRALQDSRMTGPDEIPSLDCKWVRAKCSAIVDMFQILLRYSSWGASGQSDKAYIAVAWIHFLRAIRDASSKEIKPSAETKHATGTILAFLARIWQDSVLDTGEIAVHTAAQIRQMTRSSVMELGHHMMLTALESSDQSIRLPFICSELSLAIFSELSQQQDHLEVRSHPSNHRIPVQSLLPQYAKCLNLMENMILEYVVQGDLHNLTEGMSEVDLVLLSSPNDLLLSTLTRLHKPLALILKDEAGILRRHSTMSESQRYENFGETIISVLGKLPPTNVEAMDDIFSSLFTSRSVTVVNHAITMWNATFGSQETTTLGPSLKQALLELQKFTDIDIPGMPLHLKDLDLCAVSSPPACVETLSSPSHYTGRQSLSPADVLAVHSPEFGSQPRADALIYLEEEQSVIPSRLGTERPSSRPRSRHDDSQLHFVPIESSPASIHEFESQYLTVHQKDVRDRQRSEPAVVFPDLRSSPRPQSKSQHHGDCEFARKAAALDECPSTPTLPNNQDQAGLEILASPTPRARHYTKHTMDIEVPSSPPSMHDNDSKGRTGLETLSSPLQGPVDHGHMVIEIGIPPSDALEQFDEEMDGMIGEVKEVRLASAEEGPADLINTVIELHESEATSASTNVQDGEIAHSATVPEEVIRTESLVGEETTSAVGHPRSDSDENDILSASQLSQDLDRHVHETVRSSPNPPAIEDELTTRPTNDYEQDRSLVKHNFRKRRASNQAKPARKRRTKSSSQLSSHSLGEESTASQQDLRDTIEVVSSPSAEVSIYDHPTPERQSGISAPIPTRRRGRGRPRKHLRANQFEPRRTSQVVEATMVPTPLIMKTEFDISDDVGVDKCLNEHTDNSEMMVVDVEEVPILDEPTLSRADAFTHSNEIQDHHSVAEASVVTAPCSMEEAPDNHARPGFLTTLQAALDQLKSTATADIDLRAVDDLCFQIRFQAQLLGQKE
ncbi:uncharacterized protein A1O9_00993 [Exophiala aquamarina CBS 119918]|uniref:Telomere-associated protein Rif1 N-terminal domain-containing protein n=1 Tax=Exophiala aquamarina CBS 119918 TaxID=1182545 RepID=A0A072PUI8_9EURO|nr:uncharacterized protein A1O9_00993 [Exophiala aquamarina CBS 119918]KEF63018.1 hypothetical protein A1O9_00993 [Exophiala aquamarina CBS 119918]